jgi:hypothetical protein
MRRDLIIGFIFTVTLEFLVAGAGNITHFKPKPKAKEDEPKIEIVMPKIEPDEPEVVEDQPPVPQDIAPPMQNDVPQVGHARLVRPADRAPAARPLGPFEEHRQDSRDPHGPERVEIFDISKLDQQPVAKFQARPQFPLR